MRKRDESILQQHFCHWLDTKGVLYTASMMGVNLPVRYAVMRKRMGCKKGSPDLLIFEPNDKYKGLFIELKSSSGNIKDPFQLNWQSELNKRGYLSLIMPKIDNFSDAFNWLRDTVENYMSNKEL